MSIVTQCPGCGTTFRVTPPQLQAQQGMVRCGRCAQVFDGFKTLAGTPPPEAVAQEVSRAHASVAEVATRSPADPVVRPVIESPPAPTAIIAGESPAIVRAPVAAAERLPLAPVTFSDSAPRRRNGGWTMGVFLMLFGLAAQGAYFYRSDIAANLPEARPHLAKMCELLRCAVALPQRPRQISIEGSDMQATDPANPGLIALTATLRNQATTELGYPALDVVLTNTKDHTVARRIFLPTEYLAATKDTRSGIAPNAEITIRLDLETGDLGAAGFRLDLIAAPTR
jgi:predicted Zn finger-like uncharacterized protein